MLQNTLESCLRLFGPHEVRVLQGNTYTKRLVKKRMRSSLISQSFLPISIIHQLFMNDPPHFGTQTRAAHRPIGGGKPHYPWEENKTFFRGLFQTVTKSDSIPSPQTCFTYPSQYIYVSFYSPYGKDLQAF